MFINRFNSGIPTYYGTKQNVGRTGDFTVDEKAKYGTPEY